MAYQAESVHHARPSESDSDATSSKNLPASSVAVDPVTHLSYTSYYDIFTIGAGEVNRKRPVNSVRSRRVRRNRRP